MANAPKPVREAVERVLAKAWSAKDDSSVSLIAGKHKVWATKRSDGEVMIRIVPK